MPLMLVYVQLAESESQGVRGDPSSDDEAVDAQADPVSCSSSGVNPSVE